MDTDKTKMFEIMGKEQIFSVLKNALNDGTKFDLDKSFEVAEILIKNNAILVYYKPINRNKFVIYNDFAQLIGFIHGFLINDFESQNIYNIGIHADCGGNKEIYILSPIESAKAIASGNAIYWLKNSIVNEQITFPEETYLLVEGESELIVFPILFKSINVDIEQYKIKIYPYSKFNIKTMLSLLNHKNDTFFLLCDNDKKREISDLKREGLLNSNYHILKEGELEDYAEPSTIIEILKTFTPDIALTPEYIEDNRLRGLGTSKIIAKFYHEESIHNQNPSKPDVAKKIAKYWVMNGVPKEFEKVMNNVLESAPGKSLKK
ncbi:hypothetical protein KA005_29840 [bacterium]|nr:hypothetical protein [bacterium]